MPLFAKTRQPLSEPSQIMGLLQTITDAEGRFRFEDIPAGKYRIFAQTWEEEGEATVNLMEMPLGPVEFRGTVPGVEVPSRQAGNLELRTNPEIPMKRRMRGTRATKKLKVMAPAMKKMLSSSAFESTRRRKSRKRRARPGLGAKSGAWPWESVMRGWSP